MIAGLSVLNAHTWMRVILVQTNRRTENFTGVEEGSACLFRTLASSYVTFALQLCDRNSGLVEGTERAATITAAKATLKLT